MSVIAEKKLIDDLIHNDGMKFEVKIAGYTPEALGNAFQEFINEMKKGFIDLIKSQPSVEWISVNERLPDEFISVLVYMPSEAPMPTVHEGYYVEKDECFMVHICGSVYTGVTHWMPLPEPPKDGEP